MIKYIIKRVSFLVTLVVLTGVLAQAQTTNRAQTRAENRASEKAQDVYDDLGYKASVPLFESEGKLSLKQMVQLATAYRLNHDTQNAERWYGQVVATGNAQPEHLLYYAQALQSNGRLTESSKYYKEFEDATGGDDGRGERSLNTIDQGVNVADVTIRNEQSANTDHLDFSPAFFKDGVVFVTTRRQKGLRNRLRDLWINDNFMSLAYADADPETGELGEAEEFAPELNTKYHEGPLCFNEEGNHVYFTRNTYNKRRRRDSKEGIMRLNLYESAINEEGVWSEPRELPFNTDDYEEAHPAVSADGRFLYFASDRPDGYGGMDLYVSKFTNGVWGMPDNLGPAINTAGNEAFPVLHENGNLYFASDGLGGLGGMDIFSTDVRALMGDGDVSVGVPKNIGKPFNSEKDDFGFIMNEDLTAGYLTSARGKGANKDDIYSFVRSEPAARKLRQVVCVYEAPNESSHLAGAQVTIREAGTNKEVLSLADQDLILKLKQASNPDEYILTFAGENQGKSTASSEVKQMTVGADGTVAFDADPGKRYAVEVNAMGYTSEEIEFEVQDNGQSEVMQQCVGLMPVSRMDRPMIGLTGITRNSKYGNMIADVDLTLINMCTGEEETTRSDAAGKFTFGCVPCGCEFIVKGEKNYFASSEMIASTLNNNCEAVPCNKGGVVEVELAMTPGENKQPAPPVAAVQRHTAPAVGQAPYELGGGQLTAGSVIELKNIYYDFDESYIRPDAEGDLNHIVNLMQSYPGMLIELGSHTDARASATYNEGLSQRRAEEARTYLIQRGVDSRRITARGFGESQLRNQCADYVECSETDHQVNRRTEVKIVSMGNADVEVRYVNEGPEKIDAADPKRIFVWK